MTAGGSKKTAIVTFMQQRTARSSFEAGRKVGRSREERGEAAGLERKGEGVFALVPGPAAKLVVGNVALSGRVPQKLSSYRHARHVRRGRALRARLLRLGEDRL